MHPSARTRIGLLALLSFAVSAPVARSATAITAVRMVAGVTKPLFVTSPPGDPRLFIVEQRGTDGRGRIRIFKPGAAGLLARPFYITQPLSTQNEEGLLGLAFAPDYASSGRFYLHYTDLKQRVHIERRYVSDTDPDSADVTRADSLLVIYHPYVNHNGGWIAFSPDG